MKTDKRLSLGLGDLGLKGRFTEAAKLGKVTGFSNCQCRTETKTLLVLKITFGMGSFIIGIDYVHGTNNREI